jgi:hypothetical protein
MQYGNPHYEHIELVKNSELLRVWEAAGILAPLLQIPYPDEMVSVLEIQQLISRQKLVDSQRIAYCNLVDDYQFDVWKDYLVSLGIAAGDVYEEIRVFEPIIDYLKLHYSRPRPFQIAGLHQLPLYPLSESASTDSAYPAGHVLFGLFIYHKYCQVAPHLKKQLMAMVLDIKASREELGLHYPSDGLFSFKVYQHIKPYMTATPLQVNY